MSIWHLVILFTVFGGIVPLWRIVSKAGFPGVLALLVLVPIVNIVMLWVFAFVRWPANNSAV